MPKANFFLEKRTDKSTGQTITDNVPLLLIYNFDGKKLRYFTGHRIDFDKWDSEKQEVTKNSFNKQKESASEINRKITKIKTILDDTYEYYKVNKKSLEIDKLRLELAEKLNPVVTDKKEKSFFEIFQDFINAEKVTWSANTTKRVTNSMNHLKEFDKKYKKNLVFNDINEDFFQKFIEYSINEKKHKNATILKQIKNTKLFLNWASRKKLHKNTDYKNYQPSKKLKGTNRVNNVTFLTWKELMNLYNLPIEKKYLEQVRDIFCFCCFSGLRYSDVHNLRWSNIKKDTIDIITIKTNDSLSIDLNNYSNAILDKYRNANLDDNKCFPVISNQKMNDYLKELGQLAKMNERETFVSWQGAKRIEETFFKWEILTTHVGRKTFVTNAVFFNIPAETIMEWTGHKDHEVFKKYYKIQREQMQREMNKFNQ